MANVRSSRVSEQMQREIADIIRNEVKDPRVGFVTVTEVEVTGDLQHAKIFVSVLGDDEARQNSLTALSKATGFIRGEVARRIRLRITPELSFKLDTSIDYSDKIQGVLRRLHEEEPAGDKQSSGDN
ncbi:MAG: ribosome-binding factor [Bacilli bacterium]|nr:ribosome-binding factor [Bacilli bacterium]